MKVAVLLGSIITLAIAGPIQPRQFGGGSGARVGSTAKEFTQGGCKEVTMLFARGSTEAGNMGTICGPPAANGLKQNLGADRVAVEGVDYGALLSTNALPGGADPAGIREMKNLVAKASSECPDSKLVVGGYRRLGLMS